MLGRPRARVAFRIRSDKESSKVRAVNSGETKAD